MSVGLMLAWMGILAINVFSVLAPLFAGWCLADRQQAIEARETAEIEARALAMLAGLGTRHS